MANSESEAEDGKSLYYYRDGAIWNSGLQGENELRVVDCPAYFSWKLQRQAIWILDDSSTPARLSSFDPFTHKRTQMGTLDIGPPALAGTGFDVSPDGHTLVYTRVDSLQSDVTLVENFH